MAAQPGQWQCGVCTLFNPPTAVVCSACGRPDASRFPEHPAGHGDDIDLLGGAGQRVVVGIPPGAQIGATGMVVMPQGMAPGYPMQMPPFAQPGFVPVVVDANAELRGAMKDYHLGFVANAVCGLYGWICMAVCFASALGRAGSFRGCAVSCAIIGCIFLIAGIRIATELSGGVCNAVCFSEWAPPAVASGNAPAVASSPPLAMRVARCVSSCESWYRAYCAVDIAIGALLVISAPLWYIQGSRMLARATRQPLSHAPCPAHF